MSLSTIHRDIEAALQATKRFTSVGIWMGDIQALVDTPKMAPAAFVILSGVDYDEPATIGAKTAKNETLWSVIIFEYVSTSSNDEIAAYQAMETTVAALINLPIGNRRLWPVQGRLLGAVKNSIAAYGVQFSVL